jgi:long-chain fatty acid transport protein
MSVCPARRTIGVVAAALLLGFDFLTAQDFSPFEPGARAAGLGGAFVSRADDATAIFYNPAGLAFLKGLRLKTSLGFGWPKVTALELPAGPEQVSHPFQFRGSFSLGWAVHQRVTVGLGLFTPYFFNTQWPDLWTANDVAVRAGMNAIYVRPCVSVELPWGLALGSGIDFVFAKLHWLHNVDFPSGNFPLPETIGEQSSYELTGRGAGFVAGLLWKIHPLFRVGLRYQHQVPVTFSGQNVYLTSTWPYAVPDPRGGFTSLEDLLRSFYKAQRVERRLTFPSEIAAGMTFAPAGFLSFSVEVQRDRWSAFGGWEFRALNESDLNPEFGPALREFYGVEPDYGFQSAGLVFKDAWKIKGGIEVRPTSYLALRGGFARHQSPVAAGGPNPVHPVPDQTVVSLGFGYDGPVFSALTEEKIGGLSFDVYLRYGYTKSQAADIPGSTLVFRAKRLDFGVGVGFVF